MKKNELLSLAKKYSRKSHTLLLPRDIKFNLKKFEYIYDSSWESTSCVPYEVLTYLLDCYYHLPERPDLASLFCWQAVNNSYNEILISSGAAALHDSDGIKKLIRVITGNNTKYYIPLHSYIDRLDDKVFRYMASYLLKGYVCSSLPSNQKCIIPSVYKSITSNVSIIHKIIDDSYGKAYASIVSPAVVDAHLKLNICSVNSLKSRNIVGSFAKELKKLFLLHRITLQKHGSNVNISYQITDNEELYLLMFGIIYASRCNNFHGNVPSRLNTLNSNVESYRAYMGIFFTCYEVLAISLNFQNKLSDSDLLRINDNYKLL
ncbi:hypothetical protein [Fibrobacter succinogenes]|uniref:Uncharacterized protein n=1 Tax=Fibrobacter succinogenes TaxID=833 RepID=A0A380S5N0_FIBSU|nr:hypothetical protein [Fibrobacter succinogenes]PWJ35877.1 hypothetical protein IE02_1938 [Fibrobacter succinogenes subsp. elongatus]SUQ24532.1 hypothetical protein SAMN05661053_1938 [Fibrobacter succinogenes]